MVRAHLFPSKGNNMELNDLSGIDLLILREALTLYSRQKINSRNLNRVQLLYNEVIKTLDINGWPNKETIEKIEIKGE